MELTARFFFAPFKFTNIFYYHQYISNNYFDISLMLDVNIAIQFYTKK